MKLSDEATQYSDFTIKIRYKFYLNNFTPIVVTMSTKWINI